MPGEVQELARNYQAAREVPPFPDGYSYEVKSAIPIPVETLGPSDSRIHRVSRSDIPTLSARRSDLASSRRQASVGQLSPSPLSQRSNEALPNSVSSTNGNSACSSGPSEMRRLQAELQAWGDELKRREAEIECSENPESAEEILHLRSEVAMQAEQLRGIVGLLRRGLREADIHRVPPRLLENEEEEAEKEEIQEGHRPPLASLTTSANNPQADDSLLHSRTSGSSPGASYRKVKADIHVRVPPAVTLRKDRSRISSPKCSPQRSFPASQLRFGPQRSPSSGSRRSPRPRSLDANGYEYPRASSQSRSNLRTMSPESSAQALPPPVAVPPPSPTRIPSRRTLPARMTGGAPASWYREVSAAAPSTSSSVVGTSRLISSSSGLSAASLKPGSIHLGARAATVIEAPTSQNRSSSSSGSASGRPSPAVSIPAAEGPPSRSQPQVRSTQSWQVLSTPTKTVQCSNLCAPERRLNSASWMSLPTAAHWQRSR